MAPRANWKGYLKLSLVSCAVQLYPARRRKERRHVHWSTGKPATASPATRRRGNGRGRGSDHQVKGYEIGKRDYVILEDDEIESVAIESTHTIDIESFVPRAEIDEVYLETALLSHPGRQGGGGGLRGDPGRDAGEKGRRPRPRRPLPPRAHRHAGAARQGHCRQNLALRLRGARGCASISRTSAR